MSARTMIGALDKPFHRPECRCDDCYLWLLTKKDEAEAEIERLQAKMAKAAAIMSNIHCRCISSSASTLVAIQCHRCMAIELLTDGLPKPAAEAGGGE